MAKTITFAVACFFHEKAWAFFGAARHATTRDHASKNPGKVFDTHPGSLIRT